MRILHVGLDLLDREVLDRDDHPVGKVDDVELDVRGDGSPPYVSALLLGPQALAPRVNGRIGSWMARVAATASSDPKPVRIPVGVVREAGVSVKLGIPVTHVPEMLRVERLLRDHFIGRIPWSHRASE